MGNNKTQALSIRLPKLISDGMVLQRGIDARIWGWSEPDTKITVVFQGVKKENQSDVKGQWQVVFERLEVGGPFEMTIEVGKEQRVIKDVYVGDVWLCSGQSNMELPINRVRDYFKEELKNCDKPSIRTYKIQGDYNFDQPLDIHVEAKWKVCSEENIGEFSALGYFFADYIQKEIGVPIGIIDASLGGSPIESWLPEEQIEEFPQFKSLLNRYRDINFVAQRLEQNDVQSRKWNENLNSMDEGLRDKPWYSKDIDDENWKEIQVPGWFKDTELEGFIGSVWLRKKFTVPNTMLETECEAWLGTIVDRDETYINGQLVGRTEYQYPPRKYKVPKGILHKGENTIALRITCDQGRGRFTPDKEYKLFTKEDTIDLTGVWRYKIGTTSNPTPGIDFVQWKPTGLYNAMLAPCRLYSIKGVIWYQGESNAGRPEPYDKLLTKLITCWRSEWKQGDFPFLVVQLPNFGIDMPKKGGGWPELREAQQKVEHLPYVGVVTTIDLGEANDLHPLDKKSIAYRLSLAARQIVYNEPVDWQGPRIETVERTDNGISLTFSHVGQGLLTKDNSLPEEFEVAGEEGNFYQTKAEVQGEKVYLQSQEIRDIRYVRYAYSGNPSRGLLYNTNDLPMVPFQIDINK